MAEFILPEQLVEHWITDPKAEPIVLTITRDTAFVIAGQLQLALQVPDNSGISAEIAKDFVRQLHGVMPDEIRRLVSLEYDGDRRCRECGCTQSRACIVDGVPCHWVAEDLCSACAPVIILT